MNNPWEQKKPLTVMQVRSILQNNLAGLSVQSISMFGEGWDNTTWLVNENFVFRLPKHKEAASLIVNEMRVLVHLPNVAVNVPKPIYQCTEPKGFPYPFYGHSLVPGKTADKSRLSDVDRLQLAVSIARFLKTLHAFPIEQAEKLGIVYDRISRVAIKERVDAVKQRLSYLVDQHVIESATPFMAQYQRYIDLKIPEEWVLAHGGFYARHLVLDDNKHLTGVIDWGDSELIHPAVDLAIVYQFLPSESHQTFWQEYGEVSETTKIIAKLRAIYSAVTMAWYAHQVADKSLLLESLSALSRLKLIL